VERQPVARITILPNKKEQKHNSKYLNAVMQGLHLRLSKKNKKQYYSAKRERANFYWANIQTSMPCCSFLFLFI
jgi:hypothetical protein